jgi:hypothetical protein
MNVPETIMRGHIALVFEIIKEKKIDGECATRDRDFPPSFLKKCSMTLNEIVNRV